MPVLVYTTVVWYNLWSYCLRHAGLQHQYASAVNGLLHLVASIRILDR